MENTKIINLSFDDNGVKMSRHNERTIVTMVSYFRTDKLLKFMNELGFEGLPNVVYDIFKKYGYSYDYSLNGWSTKTIGVTILDNRDSDDQGKANRIAMTKAKVKAYDRAKRCMDNIKTVFANAMILFDDSQLALNHYLEDENEALDRVIDTGYCNPNKQ